MSAVSITQEMQVPFFDVDSCNIVWHGNYAKYFEVIRCALLDKIGYNYLRMAEDGYMFPIVKIDTKFIKPLLFTQHFSITATLLEWEGRIRIRYVIRDAEGDKVTTGETVQVAVEVASKEMSFQTPEPMLRQIEKALAASA